MTRFTLHVRNESRQCYTSKWIIKTVDLAFKVKQNKGLAENILLLLGHWADSCKLLRLQERARHVIKCQQPENEDDKGWEAVWAGKNFEEMKIF